MSEQKVACDVQSALLVDLEAQPNNKKRSPLPILPDSLSSRKSFVLFTGLNLTPRFIQNLRMKTDSFPQKHLMINEYWQNKRSSLSQFRQKYHWGVYQENLKIPHTLKTVVMSPFFYGSTVTLPKTVPFLKKSTTIFTVAIFPKHHNSVVSATSSYKSNCPIATQLRTATSSILVTKLSFLQPQCNQQSQSLCLKFQHFNYTVQWS